MSKAINTAIAAMVEKLARVGVSKDKENKEQRYKFRGIDDIRNAVAPLQKECGLFIWPEVKTRTENSRTTKSGGTMLHVVLEVSVHFTSIEDDSEIVLPIISEALDTSDKATSKALSYAYRDACINMFNIPTEGESKADEEVYQFGKEDKAPTRAFNTNEECDVFVEKFIRLCTEATTIQKLGEVQALNSMNLALMGQSTSEHEASRLLMCRAKYKEKLDDLKETEKATKNPIDDLLGGA